ncbi:MAG: response regulator transcription factor [Flavobacteriales bacterium]
MTHIELEKHLDGVIENILVKPIDFTSIEKSKHLLDEINVNNFYLTIHDVETYRPICINNRMKTFYGLKNNWLNTFDYLYYLKTVHFSTYNALLQSVHFFKSDDKEYLHLEYKLKKYDGTWNILKGVTKTIYRNTQKEPKYAISLLTDVKETKSTEKYQIECLTPREREIIQLLCLGKSKKHISQELNISYHTVHTHVKNIYSKLEVHKISNLYRIAEKYGLLMN